MYDCAESCNKCGGVNKLTVTESLTDSYSTECKTCGFQDNWNWDTGHFSSRSEMVGMCDQYYYDGGKKRVTKRAMGGKKRVTKRAMESK